MNDMHDPRSQIELLRQSLSNNKRPLGIFIGAGCPMAIRQATQESKPLIPDIAGLTSEIRKSLNESKQCPKLLSVLDEQFKIDKVDNPSIEYILSHIRSLRAVSGNGEVRGLSSGDLDRLDVEICKNINDVMNKPLPDESTPYHSMASWIMATTRDYPIEIFTTNYDLLIEQACDDCHVPYFDGFSGGRKPFFDLKATEEDKLPSRWARLWKLHGSINWYQANGKGVFRSSMHESSAVTRVIHPSHLKYQESRRMPYLAMIDRLHAFLKNPTSVLVICGYSFGDEHLNEAILQGLEYSQKTVAFALLYDNLDKYPAAIKLAVSHPKLILLARDGGVIGRESVQWTEQDFDSEPTNNSKWISWNNVAERKYAMRLTLGDFKQFGQFLDELSTKDSI